MKFAILSQVGCLLMASCMTASAATNCRVVDFPDHYELICNGDEKTVPATVRQGAVAAKPSVSEKKPAVRTESMKRLLDYRLNRPMKAGWQERVAMRMKAINAEQQQQPRNDAEMAVPEPEQMAVPEPEPMGVSDQPMLSPQEENNPEMPTVAPDQMTDG